MFIVPFSSKGRIRRTEFWITYLIYTILALTIEAFVDKDMPIHYIAYFPLLWFKLAQGAKRCHDRNNSDWYQIIPFYELWMLFGDSDFAENGYGLNPKGIGNGDEIEDIGVNE